MGEFLAKSSGFTIQNLRFPPFEIKRGQLLGFHLGGGPHYHILRNEFILLLTKKKRRPEIAVSEPFALAELLVDRAFSRLLFPRSVKNLIEKQGGQNSLPESRLYEQAELFPNSKINGLNHFQKKWVALCLCISKGEHILLDMLGITPKYADQIVDLVAEYVSLGGTAIVVDNFNDSKVWGIQYYQIRN